MAGIPDLSWLGIELRHLAALQAVAEEQSFVRAGRRLGHTQSEISNATLVVGVAILTEAALSFLGFGIQPPTPALGKLIADGQDVSSDLWWLVTFPGLTIVLIVLCINFVGDGLRDALDPTQRRTRA